MNKKVLAVSSICIVLETLLALQPSQALDLKKLFDPILKRGVCATLGVQTGECAPEPQNTPESGYPSGASLDSK
jgi:hypothetical protein